MAVAGKIKVMISCGSMPICRSQSNVRLRMQLANPFLVALYSVALLLLGCAIGFIGELEPNLLFAS